MKYFFSILLLVILAGCSGKDNKKAPNKESIETIPIDIKKYNEISGFDISFMMDTSYFEIIPLETNDKCLIAEMTNIYLRNNKIIVYDKMAKGAYIFNRDGSYHAKVQAVGQGPGEYPDFVNDIFASDNYIAVLAITGIMIYDFDGKFVKKIPLQNLWGRNIFTFDEKDYYLVNCWSAASDGVSDGYWHLFKFNTESNKIDYYWPFEKGHDKTRGWGLKKYYSMYDTTALVYVSSIDTLYSLTPHTEVFPKYAIDIVHNKLPDDLRKGNSLTAVKSAIKNGYIMGVKNVAETSRYLFLLVDNDYWIYDKKEKETIARSYLFCIAPFWDEMPFQVLFSADKEGRFVTYWSGSSAYSIKTYMEEQKALKTWKFGDGTNAFQKEVFKVVNNMEGEEDNPVLLILKTKDENERY